MRVDVSRSPAAQVQRLFPLVPTLGWRKAFEKHFSTELEEFYEDLEEVARTTTVQRNPELLAEHWCSLLRSIE